MESRLYLQPWKVVDDQLEVAACLRQGSGAHRLWWRLPMQWRDAVTRWADPFVVGFIFPMMQSGGEVLVEGNVSPSLLKNLDLYAAIWHTWFPKRYQPVRIRAQKEVELPRPDGAPETIVAFSCGVDSSYTILRHYRGLMGRRNRNIGAALVMNGFDIWLDQENASTMYAGLLEGARAMLKSINVPCLPVTSNFHDLPTIWADSHGTHLASGLMLFAGRFAEALIPNSTPYNVLEEPWGSHPVCDPYMGGDHFRIADDAGETARSEKIKLLSQWPEAMRHLRVCYSNPGNHENCCRCGKCIRTILVCRMVGINRPEAFKKDVDNYHISRAKLYYELGLQSWTELRKELEACGMGKTSWVRAMRTAERRCHRRWWLRTFKEPLVPLRNKFRKLFRGSTLSQRELANTKIQLAAGGNVAR